MANRKTKNTTLLISLVILVVISVALYWLGMDQRPEMDRGIFRLEETERIDEVLLISGKDTVELKFQGRWKVNGQWDADAQMIKVLFATLKQVEPRRPVASIILDSVVNQLQQRGTTVILSEAGLLKMKLIAGGNADRTQAWFLKDGDRIPYIVNIPGYHVFVSGIFELDRNGWRSKRIFDFNWRGFRSLSMKFPHQPKQDFSVSLSGKLFEVENMEATDTTRLNDFLDNVSLLFADRYTMKDEVDTTRGVLAMIRIRDVSGRIWPLDLYEVPSGNPAVFGRLSDGEWVAINRNALSGIIRGRDYFQLKR